MSTQASPTRKPAGAIGASSSTAVGQTSATERIFEEIQLARLSARLKEVGNTGQLVRAFGGDPNEYASQLAKQYSDLTAKLRGSKTLPVNRPPARVAARLNQLADIFNWWESVVAPNATPLLTVTPPGADPDSVGPGPGADIFPGDLALWGNAYNPTSSQPTDEAWWLNSWQYIIPLPATPSTFPNSASLSYRFNIGASLAFYGEPVVTGSVHVYATVATTNDLNSQPIDFNNPDSSQFPIVATLPVTDVPEILSGGAKFLGTIPLLPGATPAIGIIIGLVFGIGGGGNPLTIVPGEYSNISLAPPDATSANDLGKVEFRTDQPFWVEAVSKMFTS